MITNFSLINILNILNLHRKIINMLYGIISDLFLHENLFTASTYSTYYASCKRLVQRGPSII